MADNQLNTSNVLWRNFQKVVDGGKAIIVKTSISLCWMGIQIKLEIGRIYSSYTLFALRRKQFYKSFQVWIVQIFQVSRQICSLIVEFFLTHSNILVPWLVCITPLLDVCDILLDFLIHCVQIGRECMGIMENIRDRNMVTWGKL